ncbi:MAG: tRNA 2-selenouridine(34) synthase MnmH [Bdellovibrionales bacterium]|nr:tRNA 2-selenouridine(34) synthase MnmH [Bdellovibrionales bacterium]
MSQFVDYSSIGLHTPLLDVRAPIEFGRAHLPGSFNSPILTDIEREEVGICYKHRGSAEAERLGFQLVSGEVKELRVQEWIQIIEKQSVEALLCWRGGKRSEIAQGWLREAGYALPRLRGGYKQARHFLTEQLGVLSENLEFLVVEGFTGSGKTELISSSELQNGGALNLEGFACHSGSSFGGLFTSQPGQATFENAIAHHLIGIHRSAKRRVLVEDESRLIGKVVIPECLLSTMRSSCAVCVDEPIDVRVRRIVSTYIRPLFETVHCEEVCRPIEMLLGCLRRIKGRLGGVETARIEDMLTIACHEYLKTNDETLHDGWVEALLRLYYDPRYEYSQSRYPRRCLFRGRLEEVKEYFLG